MLSKIISTALVTFAFAAAKDEPTKPYYKTAFCPAGWDTVYPAHCPKPEVFDKFCPTTECKFSSDNVRDANCRCKCDKNAPACDGDEKDHFRRSDCTCIKKGSKSDCPKETPCSVANEEWNPFTC